MIVLSGEDPLFNLFVGGKMEEKVRKIIGNNLDKLGLTIDSVTYEKENNHNLSDY